MSWKKSLLSLAVVSLAYGTVATSGLFADDATDKNVKKDDAVSKKPTKEELYSPESINKISEAYGHLIYKNLDSPALRLNMDAVIKGIQDAKANKPGPMTEKQFEETARLISEYAFQDLAANNLATAEDFLKKNEKVQGVIVLEPGKLQYQVVAEGTGDVVTEDTNPQIRYKATYADNTVFGQSDDTQEPISLSLNQTIPGFRRGVMGMKVGEKRKIYIHPDLGYGLSGQMQPNALLIFDVEVAGVKPKTQEEKDAEKQLSEIDEFDDEDQFEEDIASADFDQDEEYTFDSQDNPPYRVSDDE